jgi:hypothetical protein
MLDFISLNPHQKKALVIELYNQGKTRRQIAETVLNGGLLMYISHISKSS